MLTKKYPTFSNIFILTPLLLILTIPSLAKSALISATPSNYQNLLSSLMPGDTLQLQAGTYVDGLLLENMNGKQSLPITISGPTDGQVAEFLGDSCCNTIQIRDSSYLVIENFTVNGQDDVGVGGIDGVNGSGVTHHITINNLLIIGHGADKADIGISTKGPAWDWLIRNNTIIRAGTGMYLGDSTGDEQFVRGIIENNLMIDTIGYNMQIKHQNPRSTIVGFPVGASKTIIRHNVYSKQSNYSVGGLARPNLLVGHFPLSGQGMDDLYEIYGNFFYQNPSEALFQGEGNIAFYNNIMLNDFGDALNIVAHNDFPRFITVFQNTVVANGSGIRVLDAVSGYQQIVIANAVFASNSITAPIEQSNIQDSYAAATNFLSNPTTSLGSFDLYPKIGMLTGTVIDLTPYAAFTEGGVDFNGDQYDARFRGAYAGEGINLGWKPQLEIMSTYSGPTPINPRPQIFLDITPTSIESGATVTVVWSTTKAETCLAAGDATWNGTKATASPALGEVVGPLYANTTLSITCTGAGGSTLRSVNILVAAIDSVAPTIESVSATAIDMVQIIFSESVNQSSATDIGNYTIDNGVIINGASLAADQMTVILTTSNLIDGTLYRLTANNIFDLANTPNQISAASGKDFTYQDSIPANGLFPANYEWDTLSVGTKVYVDRTYTIADFPSEFAGFTYVRTANDDKAISGQNSVIFSVSKPSIIYVAFDQRNASLPQWMIDGAWQDTQKTISSTDTNAIMQVYKKNYSVGEVILGGNESESSMYFVLIARQEITVTPSPTPTPNPTTPTSDGQSGSGSMNILFIVLLSILGFIGRRYKFEVL